MHYPLMETKKSKQRHLFELAGSVPLVWGYVEQSSKQEVDVLFQ